MGHRANLIVVREGRYDLRYSHWAANTLPRDLFWGPQHALAFIEVQPDADGWLDDVWSEGGAVLDVERRVFRLFGGEDFQYDAPLRRLYLELLAAVWQGWDVGWAEEGIADQADYVGVPRENVLSPCNDEGAVVLPFEPPRALDWVDLVGSVRLGDQTLRWFPLSGDLERYLLGGPALAEAAANHPGVAQPFSVDGECTFPVGGFHIDAPSRRLEYWAADIKPGLPKRIAARWPTWSVHWCRDRYEEQRAACDGLFAFPERTRESLFAQLRSILLHVYSGGGFIDTALLLAKSGYDVQVNPTALREERVEIPLADRTEILQRAAHRLGLT